MLRPPSMSEPDTYDQILDAARALVREEGRPQLSIRKVARKAGVSVGSVQYYFQNLDALLDAVTDPWHTGLSSIVKRCAMEIPQSDDREERLLSMCLEIYDLAVECRELVRTRRIDTIERGELAPRRAESAQFWMDAGAKIAAAEVGGDEVDWRLLMQGVEHLVIGFASANPDSIAEWTEGDPERVRAFLRHALLGMSRQVLSAAK